MVMAHKFTKDDFVKTRSGEYLLFISSGFVGEVKIMVEGEDAKDKKFIIERMLTKQGDTKLYVFDSNNVDMIVRGEGSGDIYREGGIGDTISISDGKRNILASRIFEGDAVSVGNGDGNVMLSSNNDENFGNFNIAIKAGKGDGDAINASKNGLAFREDLGSGDAGFEGAAGIAYHGPFDDDLFSDLLSALKKPLGKAGIDIPYELPHRRFMHTIDQFYDMEIKKLMEINEKNWDQNTAKKHKESGMGNAVMTHTGKYNQHVLGGAIRSGAGTGNSSYVSRDGDRGDGGYSFRFGEGEGDANGYWGAGKNTVIKGGPGKGNSMGEYTEGFKNRMEKNKFDIELNFENENSHFDKKLKDAHNQFETNLKNKKINIDPIFVSQAHNLLGYNSILKLSDKNDSNSANHSYDVFIGDHKFASIYESVDGKNKNKSLLNFCGVDIHCDGLKSSLECLNYFFQKSTGVDIITKHVAGGMTKNEKTVFNKNFLSNIMSNMLENPNEKTFHTANKKPLAVIEKNKLKIMPEHFDQFKSLKQYIEKDNKNKINDNGHSM